MSEQVSKIPTYRIPVYGTISELTELNGSNVLNYNAVLVCDNNLISDAGATSSDGSISYNYSDKLIPYKYNSIELDESGNYYNSCTVFSSSDTNNTLTTDTNRIFDGDLPLIDIRLLCRSVGSSYISSRLISCDDTLEFSDGKFTFSNGDAVVSVAKLTEIITDVSDYLINYGDNGTTSFWTTPVQVTT